jgi:L-malate glycosyltransferase
MISVLLSTRNRAQVLELVLESYTALDVPPRGWQLVVVDNGSTDDTPNVLERFVGRLPLVSCTESRAGKTIALNTGFVHVKGDLVLLADDDALPNRHWLTAYAAAAEAQPGVQIFGGPVVCKFPVQPESWMLADISIALACFAFTKPGIPDGPVDPLTLCGANIAVRRSAFPAGQAFDPNVGPNGSTYAMGSETEMVRRLVAQGCKASFVTAAPVEHIIRHEQLNRKWMLQRAERSGRGIQRVFHSQDGHRISRALVREALRHGWGAVGAALRGDRDQRFVHQWYWTRSLGRIRESWNLAGGKGAG